MNKTKYKKEFITILTVPHLRLSSEGFYGLLSPCSSTKKKKKKEKELKKQKKAQD